MTFYCANRLRGLSFCLMISLGSLFQLPLTVRRQLVAITANKCDDGVPSEEYITRFRNVARLYNDPLSLQRLWNSECLVIGLGGVGSWTVEALARSGIRGFTLVDMDDICISNINRQIQCLTSTVGKFKADVLRERILEINPDAKVTTMLTFVRPDNVDEIIFKNGTDQPFYDFVIDAADGVSDKAAIVDACVRSSTPIVVCGGAGGLMDPTLLRVSDMSRAVGDNLVMRVRKYLRQKLGYPKGTQLSSGKKLDKKWGILTVHTVPTGIKRGTTPVATAEGNGNEYSGGFRKCDTSFGNACFATGAVGFALASVAVNAIASGTAIVPRSLGFRGAERPQRHRKQTLPHDATAASSSCGCGQLPVTFDAATAKSTVMQTPLDDVIADAEDTEDAEIVVLSGKQGGDGASQNLGNSKATLPERRGGEQGGVREGMRVAGGADNSPKSSDGSGTHLAEDILSRSAQRGFVPCDVPLVDAHCHLQLGALGSRAAEAISNAQTAGLVGVVVCATCPGPDWEALQTFQQLHPEFVRPQFGLHPWWISRQLSLEGRRLSAAAASTTASVAAAASTSVSAAAAADTTGSSLNAASVATNDAVAVVMPSLATDDGSGCSSMSEGGLSSENCNGSSGSAGGGVKQIGENIDSTETIGSASNPQQPNGGGRGGGGGWQLELERVLQALPLSGVGECGLDKNIKHDVSLELQEEVLKAHLRLAAKYARPLTIHCVGAWGRLLEILQEQHAHECELQLKREDEEAEDVEQATINTADRQSNSATAVVAVAAVAAVDVEAAAAALDASVDATSATSAEERSSGRIPAVILHSCNSMSAELIPAFAKMPNVFFSVTGRSLSPKETRLFQRIPLPRLLLETDSPDQLPTDLKDCNPSLPSNEPAVLQRSCAKIAGILGMEYHDLAQLTVANTRLAYNL